MTGKYTVFIILVILLVSILVLTSCQNTQQQPGTLEGIVTIGPIWPVERLGESRPVPPQVFETRKVIVYNKSGKRVIKIIDLIQIDQSARASYGVQLAPGQYVVDITHSGIDSGSEVPKKVEIKSGQTVVVDIDIDTGIR